MSETNPMNEIEAAHRVTVGVLAGHAFKIGQTDAFEGITRPPAEWTDPEFKELLDAWKAGWKEATERKQASRPATDKPSEPFLENLITYADAASWKTAADLARKHKEREREQEREPERRTAALETPKGVTITITADDSASADLITVLQKLARAAAKMIEDGTLGDDD